ncbi:MAG: phosphoribosyltransferase [Acidobacteriaceae bacterium]|jgi:putative phosphoribosyl transferase
MLGAHLAQFANEKPLLVLALPRGGVPVAFEVAMALHAPLDVFLVRKLGFPGQEELAIGAIASGGARLLNAAIIRSLHLPPEQVEAVTQEETKELERREHLYRGDRAAPDFEGHTLIIVDDGIATGSSMRVAVAALRQKNPRKLIVAIPVAPFAVCKQLKHEADAVVCLSTPSDFYAVGEWYRDFSQVSDATVRDLLDRAPNLQSTDQSTLS